MRRPIMKALVAGLVGTAIALLICEVVVRIILGNFQEPIYTVLFLEPHPDVGWVHPQDFDFQWRGLHPTCIEFDIAVHMNNFGFRDSDDWQIDKPENTIRIAMLGDSQMEAIQVEETLTSSGVLETLLQDTHPDVTFEVMNFGVSNYSVGQYQLVYEYIASQFEPDVVVFHTAYFQMERTGTGVLRSYFTDGAALSIRPTYVLDDDGELEFVPAEDFETYQEMLQTLINGEFGDDRSLEQVNPNALIDQYPSALYALLNKQLVFPQMVHYTSHRAAEQAPSDTEFRYVDLNHAILKRLKEQTQADGAPLLFVDSSEYFERYSGERGSGLVAAANAAFAAENDMAYINIDPIFRAEPQSVQLPCDGHLNETGNRILAQVIFDWVQDNVTLNPDT